MPDLMVETHKIIKAAPPKDMNATAMPAAYVSLKNWDHITIIITTGAWAAGTAAVTLTESFDIAATTPVQLAFTKMWTDTATAGTLVETAVAANTFNLAIANSQYVIEVDAASLTLGSDYDCLTVAIATPGANADLYGVTYVLSRGRYQQATPPSVLID